MCRLQFCAAQRFAAFEPFSFKKCFAFANETQSQMRQRREIATRSDRSFFGNHRMQTAVQHLAKHLDNLQTNPAKAERENIRAQQHHRAYFRLRERPANAASVTPNEI